MWHRNEENKEVLLRGDTQHMCILLPLPISTFQGAYDSLLKQRQRLPLRERQTLTYGG